jgi:N-acetyl-alpha-D-glucosaminyl L-malate synthase BshA
VSGLGIGIACFSTFGGSGVIAAEVGMSLARRGHRVCFVSDGVPGRLDVGMANVSFHQVALREHPALKHNPYTLALASAMVELAQREALDLLHVHYAIPHAVSAYLARQILVGGAGGRATEIATKPPPKIVTTLHGTDITLVGIDPSFLSLTRFAILASDGLTTPSAWLRETTYRNFDIPRAVTIDVVPNFVDTDRFCPPRDRGAARAAGGARPTLVHVSNFRPVKRVDDVVKIFARVRAQLPAAELRLVGDGPERPAIEALCRSAGVAADVRFLGETVDLPEVLRGSDVFLLPSETESFGLAALEAMSCGVPVVASDVGGLPEVVVHGETGFLVPLGDVAAMAAAALRVLTDAALASRLGRAARARAEARFPIEPAVDRYEAVYRRVLAAP